MRVLGGLLCLAMALLAAYPPLSTAADAPRISLQLVEMDPASPAVLNADDTVYVRVRYHSDVPITIWVRPYENGQPAPAMSNASPVYPAGQGDALGWFAFRDQGSVDAIHLQAAPQGKGTPTVDTTVPVDFTWSGRTGPAREPAAWVAPLQKQQSDLLKQATNQSMKKPTNMGGALVVVVFAFLVLLALGVCFVWPVWGVVLWEGPWKKLAAIPLAVIVLWVLKDCSDLARDATSHNLLPFEFLEAAAVIGPYMLIVWLLRRRALKRSPASAADSS